jgi:hypothetical protein
MTEINFLRPIVYAHECSPCPMCGELICPVCDDHYYECSCPGPHSYEDEVNPEVVTG